MYHPLVRSAAVLAATTLFAISACSDGFAPDALAPGDADAASLGAALHGAALSGATLIECPARADTVVEATLDAAGGTIRLAGNHVTLPAGAVAAATRFRVESTASRHVELRVRADGRPSFTFQRPVTITIDYSRCPRGDLDRLALTVWKVDPETRGLLHPLGGVDDKEARTITFETGTLSTFSIAR
jgi:hypothetical protein